MKLKNSNCDKSEKLRLWWNSKSNCDEIQKLEWWQNSNSNCDKTQKLELWHTSNCDITQIVREETQTQNVRTQIVTNSKNSNYDKTQTQILTKLNNLNCVKNSICNETHIVMKLKLR